MAGYTTKAGAQRAAKNKGFEKDQITITQKGKKFSWKQKEKKVAEPKFKMKENFVIGARDVKQWKWGRIVKAKMAVPAVPAQEAVKDEDGKVTKAAVKGKPALPAVEASTEMYMKCVSEEVALEVMARMEDQGFMPNYEGQVFEEEGEDFFYFSYSHEDVKAIRRAYTKMKAKDTYNAPGLKALAEQEKAEAKAKREAEKAKTKEEAPKKAPKKGKKAKKEAPKEEAQEAQEEGDGWPSEFTE